MNPVSFHTVVIIDLCYHLSKRSSGGGGRQSSVSVFVPTYPPCSSIGFRSTTIYSTGLTRFPFDRLTYCQKRSRQRQKIRLLRSGGHSTPQWTGRIRSIVVATFKVVEELGGITLVRSHVRTHSQLVGGAYSTARCL